MRRPKYPEPPIERFHHGQVWKIVRERHFHPHEVRLGEARVRDENYLVMVITPTGLEWRSKTGWFRTKLVIGDLKRWPEKEIWTDFTKLLYQPRPCRRNYTANLKMNHRDYLFWQHPVDWRHYE